VGTGRLEAFSDGVIAIIITIMVLELKIPHGADLHALRPLIPVFVSYLVSFTFVAIYWNNHHHLLHVAKKVTGWVMWANMHLLFWLSLVPVVTGWVGEHPYDPWPASAYGIVLFMAGLAYLLLQRALLASHARDSALAHALQHDVKGPLSAILYALAIGLAFVEVWLADAIYVCVAVMWFVPDRRMTREVTHDHAH
jgi:uncharacterized membrane protein